MTRVVGCPYNVISLSALLRQLCECAAELWQRQIVRLQIAPLSTTPAAIPWS